MWTGRFGWTGRFVTRLSSRNRSSSGPKMAPSTMASKEHSNSWAYFDRPISERASWSSFLDRMPVSDALNMKAAQSLRNLGTSFPVSGSICMTARPACQMQASRYIRYNWFRPLGVPMKFAHWFT